MRYDTKRKMINFFENFFFDERRGPPGGVNSSPKKPYVKGPVPNRYNRFAPNREIQSKVPKSSSKRFKLTHNSSEMHTEAFVVSGSVTKCVLWVPLTAISIENEPKSLVTWHLDRFDTGRNHDIDFRALDGIEKSKIIKNRLAHLPGYVHST